MKKFAAIALTAGFLATPNINAADLDLDLGLGLPIIGMTGLSTHNAFAPAVVGQLGLPSNVMGLTGYVTALPGQLLGGGAGIGGLLGGNSADAGSTSGGGLLGLGVLGLL